MNWCAQGMKRRGRVLVYRGAGRMTALNSKPIAMGASTEYSEGYPRQWWELWQDGLIGRYSDRAECLEDLRCLREMGFDVVLTSVPDCDGRAG